MTKADVNLLRELAKKYVESLPKCAKPMAMRYLLRTTPLKRSNRDKGFVQFVEDTLPKS